MRELFVGTGLMIMYFKTVQIHDDLPWSLQGRYNRLLQILLLYKLHLFRLGYIFVGLDLRISNKYRSVTVLRQ
jgi:hypothetical protein